MNTSNYNYEAPKLGMNIKIRNFIAGYADRNSILSQFIADNHIDIKKIDTQKVTRFTYMVRAHHVEYLAHVRDQDLTRQAAKVRSIRDAILLDISREYKRLDSEKTALASLKEDLASIKNALKEKANLTPLQKAHLQGDQGTLEASIANQQIVVNDISNYIQAQEATLKDNYQRLLEYQKELRDIFDIALNQYIKKACRKLNKIGFTMYDSECRGFSDEVEHQIKELAYVK